MSKYFSARTAVCACLLAGLLAGAAPVPAEAAIRQEQVRFKPGTTQTVLKGRIKGRETVDYRVPARPGQALSVTLKPTSRSA